MDFADFNFPYIDHGDVKIVLGASRVYQVESAVLRGATEVGREEMDQEGLVPGAFEELLDPALAVDLSRYARKKGVTTRYQLVATDVRMGGNGAYVLDLQAAELDSDGRPVNRTRPHLGLETGQRAPAVFDAFTAILGSLYDKKIDLGGQSEGLHDRIVFAVHIIDLAEHLGVKYSVADEVVEALKQRSEDGTSFFQAVAEDPAYWLEFANRIRSKELFAEAMIHAAGRLQTDRVRQAINNVTPQVKEIAERKARDVKQRVKSLLLNILSYYPKELKRHATTGYADTDNIGRNSYSNDIFAWMTLTAYRQFIAQEAIAVADREDMGYELVSAIGKGGKSYLTIEDLEPFFDIFPMTSKAKDVAEKKLKEIKDHVKPWANKLLKNNSQITFKDGSMAYFTCVEMGDEDFTFEEVERDD